MRRPGKGWIWLVLLVCLLFMPGMAAQAGEEADGSEPVIAECPETDGITVYGTDENGQELTAQTTTMVPDRSEPYVIDNKKATWLVASQSGTYHITGTSHKTLLEIKVGDNDDIRIVFRETYMTATKDCPGLPADARSVIRIVPKKGYTGGGKVTLLSEGATVANYFRSKGGVPCLRKDDARIQLILSTVDPDHPGILQFYADEDAGRAAGIGCYSTSTNHGTFGNVIFESGYVEAYGSRALGFGCHFAGPGIGADAFGDVDGLTFENASVLARGGGSGAAGIGTCSSWTILGPFGTTCRNITINGGHVEAYTTPDTSDLDYGAAGLGGGAYGSAENIVINGGKVEASGDDLGAGIGGGFEMGDATGIVINGGTVIADGGSAGIGSGQAHGNHDGGDTYFGQFEITINETDPVKPTVVEATGRQGPGIGGWQCKYREASGKLTSGKKTVNINGGKITAVGSEGNPGIGPGKYGYASDINIHGGRLDITAGKDSVAIGALCPDKDRMACVGHIRIYGGTVITRKAPAGSAAAGDYPGLIGGVDYTDFEYLGSQKPAVRICGGNLVAEMYNAEPTVADEDSRQVYLNKLAIQTFGQQSSRNSFVPVESISYMDKTDPGYGLNDVCTLPESDEGKPVLYFWLPSDKAVHTVRTAEPYLNVGYLGLKKDVYEFFGNTKSVEGGILYPPLCFLIDDNYTARDLEGGPWAEARIGETSAQINNPPVGVAGYSTGEKDLMNADGQYLSSVETDTILWTDPWNRLKIDGYSAPVLTADDYLNGIRLYSKALDISIVFNKTCPDPVTTELSGDPPAGIMLAASQESVNLPANGGSLTLPGYELNGWNSDEQGEGDHFDLGASVTRKDLNFLSGSICHLYPEWKPKRYTITFRAGDGAGDPVHEQHAIFDQPGLLDKVADFRESGWKNLGTLQSWTSAASGKTYQDGARYSNLCTLDENGDPQGAELKAVWIMDLPVTGDQANPLLYTGMIAAGILILGWYIVTSIKMRRKTK